MVCSPNTSQEKSVAAGRMMGVEEVEKHDKYLGLPMIVDLKKKDTFREIEDKMAKRVVSWEASLLLMAGRKVLIRSVLCAMPQFAMMCYRLPVSLCDKLQKLVCKFMWGSTNDKKHIHWVSSIKLTREKTEGGLGIRNFRWLSEAFLVRQAWRLTSQPELLVSKVMKGRYYSRGKIWEAGVGGNPSHAWRGIHKAIELLRMGTGGGDEGGTIEWKFDSSGCCSTKSAYKLVRLHNGLEETSNGKEVKKFWRNVWKCCVPERVKVMIWRLYNNALPDATNLKARGCDINMMCKECGFNGETALHSVRDCWKADVFWRLINGNERGVGWKGICAGDWLFQCAREGSKGSFTRIMCGVWLLWNIRNAVRRGNEGWTVEEMKVKLETMIFQGNEYLGRKMMNRIPDALFVERDREKTCIFCDGAWKVSGGGVGLAAVVIEYGVVASTVFKWCAGGIIGKDVEGEAMCLGMKVAEQRRCKEIVIVPDSLDVVNFVLMGCSRNGLSPAWSEECKRMMKDNLGWSVKHAMREDNEVADKVAHFAADTKTSWLNPWAIPKVLALTLV